MSTYAFPAVGTPLSIWLLTRTAGWRMAVLAFGIATLFGYLMPALGTAVLNKWRFHGPGRVGSLYVHHGFVYASKMAFVLWLAMPRPAQLTFTEAAPAILLTGATVAFGGWWHDIVAVRAGRIELLAGLARRGRSAEEAVTAYAPPSFFVLGATYAAVCWGAALWLQRDPGALPLAFAAALAVLCAVPAAVFLAIERNGRRAQDEGDAGDGGDRPPAIPEAGV